MKRETGFILTTVLWILLILGLLAMGLSFVGAGDLSLLKLSMGKLRAYAAARSGVVYARQALLLKPTIVDVLDRIGVDPGEGDKKIQFQDVPVGEDSSFSLQYPASFFLEDDRVKYFYGLSDERGRLNINSIISMNCMGALVFEEIVNSLEPGMGEKLCVAVVQFRTGANSGVALRNFLFLDEFALVQGVNPEIFERLKPFLTVYPIEVVSDSGINFYTANALIVRSLFKAAARQNIPGSGLANDAEAFLKCRSNAVINKMSPVEQCLLPSYMSGYTSGSFRSGVYRIRSVGRDHYSGVDSVVEAVIEAAHGDSKILYWHRE